MPNRALVVLAHPEAKSFNAQMAATARQTLETAGWGTELSDLYREGFDPCEALRHFPSPATPDWFAAQTEQRHAGETGTTPPEVRREIDRLERADFVLFQFPMWWFSVPAILKGWCDRVLVYGEVYTSKTRYDAGHFRGKRAMVSVSTGAPASTHGPDGRNADLDLLLWPFHYTLHYVGFTVLPPQASYSVEGSIQYSSPEEVAARIEGHKTALAGHLRAIDTLEPLKFNGWADWDEAGRLKPDAPSYSPFMRHP